MTTQILSPVDLGTTSKVGGRLFRKQVLPVGSINYKGRRIDFTREKLAAMEAAFRDRAFDSVPLVFADKDNAHTMDPRQTTGEMVDVELTADGLDGIFRASDEAAKLLESYPKVGVSARILENYERADGRSFPAAIQHALITSDPRITGMRPWEAVNLSSEVDGETLDLTAESFASPGEQEGVEMATPLTDDELQKLRGLLDLLQQDETSEDDGNDSEQPADEQAATDESDSGEQESSEEEVTEDELDALALQILSEEQAEENNEQAKKPETVAASNDDNAAVELANARVAEMETQLSNMQRQLDEKNFLSERDRLATEFGIPPAITDLARPLLQGHQVIELSNGNSVDAGKVMRDVLSALGKQIQLLDLSSAVGSAFETDEEKSEAAEREDFVKAFRAQNNL